MIPSRSISDYREVPLESIPLDRPISFRIYVYFPANKHIVCLWIPGSALAAPRIERYRQLGLKTVWIYSPEFAAYEAFIRPDAVAEPDAPIGTIDVAVDPGQRGEIPVETPVETPVEAPAETPLEAANDAGDDSRNDSADGAEVEAAVEAPVNTTSSEAEEALHLQEGELLKRVLQSPVLSEKEKKTVASTLSQTMIERISAAPSPAHQTQEMRRAQRLMGSLIDHLGETVHEDLKKVWAVAHFDQDLQHGVQVATFSTLFALAFGRIDETLLSELALAGLVHDVGMCRMRPSIASMPHAHLSVADHGEVQGHVQESLDLLAKYLPALSERVREIVLQHQEMFDGSGYPRGLEGFDFDDIAQLVAMADLAETVRIGQWDGEERSFRDAFALIEKLEQTKTFPHFFNPEVFRQVVQWTQRDETPATLEAASKRVAKETMRVVKKVA